MALKTFNVKAIALILLSVSGVGMPAHAAEPKTLTLSCAGTMTGYGTVDPHPLSFILSLNFSAATFESSGAPFRNGGRISELTDLTVHLTDSEIFRDGQLDVTTGSLDRLTGLLEGYAITYKDKTARTDNVVGGYRFSLKCAPVQRMF